MEIRKSPKNYFTVQSDDKQRYLHQKVILEHYWDVCKKEYFTNLREFHKNITNQNWGFQIKVGDVLFDDPKEPRSVWKMGVIQSLLPSSDGQIRTAEVRVISGDRPLIIKRTVNKLYLLEGHKDTSNQLIKITFVNEKNIQTLNDNINI